MSEEAALKIIGECEIAKLSLAPGDVLVAKFDVILSDQSASRAREVLTRCIPDGQKVLILDRGVDLSVLTRAEIEACAV
jgi:hypothetical protein